MIVVGGESGNGLLDDVQVSEMTFLFLELRDCCFYMSINIDLLFGCWFITSTYYSLYCQVLNFDTFSWTTVSSKLYLSPSSLPLQIPASKGHCLVLLNLRFDPKNMSVN